MGVTSRKVAVFLALIFYLISLSLVVCSFLTEYWVVSDVTNENGVNAGRSRVNSGLLSGMREVDWGLGVRYMPFSVLSLSASCVIFYIQFHSTMQKNLLTVEQIQAGYSTQGLAK
ncbi:hypothetical protein ANCCAN_00236 [Ancylostoma caninum]|uniref:Uncharacterized protein n=1 Tax=Ancylostoma caninum TaxID=29170 RepID=A0A368HAV7_ANCCA|nr:hypothetical protein ANCCAN_00236 [Ancylostoma caninum]